MTYVSDRPRLNQKIPDCLSPWLESGLGWAGGVGATMT